MHVLILGGTGPSGILVTKRFLEVYPDGTATLYARNPSKVPSDVSRNPNVTIVKGELDDQGALEKAFSGKHIDAVLSALGPIMGQKCDFTAVYKTLTNVMEKYKSSRLIVLSTISAEDPRDRFSLSAKLLVWVVYLIARSLYHDIVGYTAYLEKECGKKGIDYTVVRVPNLNMKTGHKYVAGYVGDGKMSIFLSRHAMADFYVSAIESKEWANKSPALSSTTA